MIEASEYTTGVITQLNCLRCLHKWFPVRPATPKHCPKCKSPYWNRPRGSDGHDVNKLPCPKCKSTNVTSCPGGTCYKPSKEAMETIKYICMDCLNEFGDYDVNKLAPVKYHLICLRCGHEWNSNDTKPRQCPKCHSGYWDKPKKKENVDAPVVATIHDVNKA